MKTSEIKQEAQKIVNSIFKELLKSDNKENWQLAFDFIDKKIFKLKIGERGTELFIWKSVKSKLNILYGKKFIKN